MDSTGSQGGGDYGIVYVSKDSPIKTYDDLVKASQAKSVKIAIPGVGSSAHLFAVLLREKAGLKSSVVLSSENRLPTWRITISLDSWRRRPSIDRDRLSSTFL